MASTSAKQPELAVESEGLFINWFNKLEQVRSLGIHRFGLLALLPYADSMSLRGKQAALCQKLLCHTTCVHSWLCLQDPRKLRVFDRKTSYTVHGPDTALVAKLYGGNGAIKQLGKAPNQLASIAINKSLYEQLLRSVLVESANRVVELYEGHGTNWRVAR